MEPQPHRFVSQPRRTAVHLCGLLLLCSITVGAAAAAKTTAVAAKLSPAQIRPSNTSLRDIEDENVLLSFAEAVQGQPGRLPCNVIPPLQGDRVILVIWYKDGLSTPIYSFDVRDAKFEKGSHWVDEQKFAGRAYFQTTAPAAAALILANATSADSGVYRCRVDFHKSPTRNARVQLRVIVPPEKVLMLDERGVHIPNYILGPYNEDSSINLTCVSIGGSPLPNVTWMHENTVLPSESVVLSDKRVKNVLHLERLQRSHLHRVLTCHAANNNVTQPITSSVTLDLNLRPLWVRLQGENRPLSADNHYELQCQVVGSKPEPTITWWKGSQPMRNTHQMASDFGNVTTSILSFTPTIDDRGKFLSCRAEQPQIPDSGKEDGWKLDIYHIPVVSLEFGTNQLNTTGLREGADVYFECNIKSNPWIYRVSWRHNGKLLDHNPSEGISVANQSLVLQNISRSSAGLYTCVGSNREGDGESNPVLLDVHFTPVCRPGLRDEYRAGRGEIVKVVCELEANPFNVSFVWAFNGTNAENIDIPTSSIETRNTTSTATYVPNAEHDFGMLLCWATNELGQQAEPCVFHILPAGRPDAVTNCSVANTTFDMVAIVCAPGFNGGLQQSFRAEVFSSDFRHHLQTVRSRVAAFELLNLNSGVHYGVRVFAYNEKGESEEVRVPIFTFKNPEKQTDFIPMAPLVLEDLKPFLPLIFGACVGVLCIGLVIIVVVRVCNRGGGSSRRRTNVNSVNSNNSNATELNHQLSTVNSEESIEKNPDIIPIGSVNGGVRQFQWMNANGFPVLYTSNDGNTYDQSPFGGGGGVVNVLSDNPAYSQFVQQQSQGNTATVSSSSYPSAALVSANSLHNYAVDFNGRGGGVPRMPYTTATLGRPRHVGVGLQASDPSICAQIDLASGHENHHHQHHNHQQQQQRLSNPRVLLGQTQMSTFPRAPPLMFASKAAVAAQQMGQPSEVDEEEVALNSTSGHSLRGPPTTATPSFIAAGGGGGVTTAATTEAEAVLEGRGGGGRVS